jgi:RND family efflux transporter MFP subunit
MSIDSSDPISPPGVQPPAPRALKPGNKRLAAIILLLAILGGAILKETTGHAKPGAAPGQSHGLPVAAAKVTREDLFNGVIIPAEFRPYLEVELHAKVSGYVREMNVDIGDRVKAGQLLARLEVPELQDELDRAVAAEKRVEADYWDAHLIYTRLVAVNKDHPNLVAQQELDTAEAKDRTTEAAIAAAKADVERYQTLVSYTRITAPFDGVITHRYADPGSLIQAGTASDTQSMPLVRLSDNYRLRLDFPVSVGFVKDVHVGDSVKVRVESLGEKTFTGRISRFADKVDDATRTMTTEIEVPNPTLDLVPGMYARVEIKEQQRLQVLAIPIEAVSLDNKGSVYVVTGNQTIENRPVTLGMATSDKYEVLEGLHEGEVVMVGSRSLVTPGQKVEAKLTESLTQNDVRIAQSVAIASERQAP